MVLRLLRFVGLGLVVFASTTTVTPAAPIPTHLRKPARLYYPTTVGTTWVYDDGYTEIVTGVTRGEDWYLVSVSRENKWGTFPYGKMLVSGSGLEWFPAEGVPAREGRRVLKLPCQPGEQWEYYPPEWPRITTVTAHETERVEVPAGVFEAIRTEYTYTVIRRRGRVVEQPSSWYAQDIGEIKCADSNGRVIRTLKSFTPGKQ
jgi:hypothetical protein